MPRLPWFGRRRDPLEGLDEEIRDHIEHEVEANLARGMSSDEARRKAHLAFGNVALVREDTRAVWSWAWFEQVRQDVGVGARILRHSPGLSLTASVLIALVVGINTTIFTMVNSLVTRPAPGVDADDLVRVAVANRPGIPYFSYPDYLDYAAQTRTLRSLAAFTGGRVTVTFDQGSFAMNATAVDSNYFDTLGIKPVRGRVFSIGEARASDATELPAILSHRAWQEYFGGRDDALGQPIAVDGQPAIVVGVMPPRFRGAMLAERADVWLPLVGFWRVVDPVAMKRFMTDRSADPVDMIGRLAPGERVAAAQSDLSTIQRRLQLAYPGADRLPLAVVPYSATAGGVIPAIMPTFMAIFSIVTLLTVLIVSANVANLILARAAVRQRETAVRQSLGASRARIVRLMLAEGASISLVAWVAACVMAVWASRAIPQLMPQAPFAQGLDLSPSWRVLAYALLLAAIGTVAFSVAPALRAWRLDVLPWLKAGEHSVAPGRSRLSSALVILQLAFSVVLLTCAGLAYRSVGLMLVDLGFETHDMLLVTVRTSGAATTRDANLALIDRLRERFHALARVQAVSYVHTVPPWSWAREVIHSTPASNPVSGAVHVVGPDYFTTIGVPLVDGRPLTAEDRDRVRPVAVINQHLADSLWPGQRAVGQSMLFGAERRQVDIVGVMRNAYVAGFNPEQPDPRPHLVFVSEQTAYARPRDGNPGTSSEVTFYLRHQSGQLDAVATSVRQAMREVDPRAAIVLIGSMDERLEGITMSARIIARLLAIFSLVSLVIAAIGQYAVVAFSMRRRVREFGVRIALGASARQVVTAVLGEGFALTLVGLVCGLVLSLGVAMLARRALFGVTPTDPSTYAAVFALLAAVALVACCLPARAATRIDPVRALRQE